MNKLFILIAIISIAGCTPKEDRRSNSQVMSNTDDIKEVKVPDKIKEIHKEVHKQAEEALPDNLLKFIEDSLTDYAVPTREDYAPNLLSFIEGLSYPYFCMNDFDGNGETDYSLLLWSDNKELFFFIFITMNNIYHPINMGNLPMGITDSGIATVLENKRGGTWTAIDTAIQAPYGGISVKLLEESRTRSYYWDGAQFVRFFAD